MPVSRVINEVGYVKETTRHRVVAAIDRLGYVPKQQARSLRSKKYDPIALLVTDVTNPFFTMVARGMEDAASAAGCLVLLGNTDEIEETDELAGPPRGLPLAH